MAIQQKAENPGQNLQIKDALQYSLAKSKRKKSTPPPRAVQGSEPVSVRTDVLLTIGVFLVLLVVLVILYFKLK